MTAVRSKSWRSLAFVVALATLFTLALPFTPQAEAQAPAGTTLEVDEEIDTNPSGNTHTLTARLYQGTTTTPAQATGTVNVDFEVESGPAVRVNCTPQPNDSCTGGTASDADNSPTSPDMTCTILTLQTSCSVVFTSDSAGTNVIRAWIDADGNNSTTEADAGEGRYAGGPPGTNNNPDTDCRGATTGGTNSCDHDAQGNDRAAQPGNTSEPDQTDVVQKTWTQTVAQACLDAEPETDTNPAGSEHTITARVTNGSTRTETTNGAFDCTGAVLAGVTVDISVRDDNPNIYIKSVNGQATGGPVAGGPDSASATTDSNGQVTVVIQCVNSTCTGAGTSNPGPTSGTANSNLIRLAVQGAQAGDSSDDVEKTWAQAGVAATFNASPDVDTNEVNQQHVITCTVSDALGSGVAGQNCDAIATGGPSSLRDVDSNPATGLGYIGQCTTGTDGTCTISYTSPTVGTDTILTCRDTDGDDACNDEAGADTETISKEWVAAGQGPAVVAIDMEGCNGTAMPTSATTRNGYDLRATDNQVSNAAGDRHQICAQAYSSAGVERDAPITFTITSGPGYFTNAQGTNLGTTVTSDPDACVTASDFACAELLSQATGDTVVQACLATNSAVCESGTKPWRAGNATGRNVECDPATASNPSGTQHVITCLVVDRFGNPVPGVTIAASETGAGRIEGTAPASGVTDANGEVEIIVSSLAGENGTQTITATISAPRGGGAADDPCEQPAGAPAGTTTAGNCTTSAEKIWGDAPPTPECSDDVDNDGDGRIDEQDLGCYDEDGNYDPDDDSEAGEALDRTVHPRTIEITKFKHIDLPGKKKPALMVKGRVTVDDGFAECNNFAPVKIQLRASGEWITRKTDITNENGVFKVLIRHVHAKYRAIATRFELFDEFGNVDVCQRAEDRRKYRH